ncbi:MAG: diaminopimelate epimerase [Armatimonadetes bacterium]|nr:diaminopimelate epimerase [Armatimonadota bacterium]
MRFTKLHGLGNDYIYLDAISQDLTGYDLAKLAQVLSDRHFGVGGDGIILILPSQVADFRMRIFNPDGSEAEMCGNGIRGFAKYVYEHGLTAKTELAVETGAGIIKPRLFVNREGRVEKVRVDMGPPRLARAEIPMAGEPPDQPVINEALAVGDESFAVTCVSMGNPHCVIFLDAATNLAEFPVSSLGPRIEKHEAFPRRTNVEFAVVDGPQRIRMRVWERGAGETLACGTGACATLVAAALTGRAERKATVQLLGGELEIEWADDDHVYMTGPAVEVFSGELSPELEQGLR